MKKINATEEYEELLQKQKEQKAVDDLAEMLCGGARRIPKETMDASPEPYKADVRMIDMETGTAKLLEDMQETVELGKMRMKKARDGEWEFKGTDERAAVIEADKLMCAETRFEHMDAQADVHEPSIMIEPAKKTDAAGDRNTLGLYNAAITALQNLNDEIEDFEVGASTEDLLSQLKQLRINTFEHLVPWEQIAKGTI